MQREPLRKVKCELGHDIRYEVRPVFDLENGLTEEGGPNVGELVTPQRMLHQEVGEYLTRTIGDSCSHAVCVTRVT